MCHAAFVYKGDGSILCCLISCDLPTLVSFGVFMRVNLVVFLSVSFSPQRDSSVLFPFLVLVLAAFTLFF